ncbi:MAG: hypothetical protein M0P31_16035 [Solirubrobacteraceae bacterium]|nr:hypothetical protein [Solirubrobacteraceae bacterium]
MNRRSAVVLAATVALVGAPAAAPAAGTATPSVPTADATAIRTIAEKYGRASVHGHAGRKVCAWLTEGARARFVRAQRAKGPCAAAWDRAVRTARRTDRGRSARYQVLSLKPLGLTPGQEGQIADRVAIRLRSIVTTRGRTTRAVGRIVVQRVDGRWLIDVVDRPVVRR